MAQSSLDITGTVNKIGDLETKGNFSKRDLWLDLPDDKYPQIISIEFSGANVSGANASKLDALRYGQHVTVSVNIGGREYNGRIFNSLRGWKIV